MSDEGLTFGKVEVKWNGTGYGTVDFGAASIANFYMKAKHDPAKSLAAGRPQYTDVPFVRIQQVGERPLNVVDRPANEQDTQRFPRQWEQFLKKAEQKPDGTPIEMLYPEVPSIALALRSNNVFTIEQCANMSATGIADTGMGCQRYVNDAKKYLDASSKGASTAQLRNEMEQLRHEMNVKDRQIEELKQLVGDVRTERAGQPTLAQLQNMIAGVMTRPQAAPGFDAQAEMINSVAPTKLEKTRRLAPNKSVVKLPAPPRRQAVAEPVQEPSVRRQRTRLKT